MNYKREENKYYLLWVQQSPYIAPTIDAIAFFCAIASIVDPVFGKTKIYKLFVDFCFAKIVSYFLNFVFLYN